MSLFANSNEAARLPEHRESHLAVPSWRVWKRSSDELRVRVIGICWFASSLQTLRRAASARNFQLNEITAITARNL
eukprot:scaffold232742_cov17-Prasinocladus_malaysianus.AAC.1